MVFLSNEIIFSPSTSTSMIMCRAHCFAVAGRIHHDFRHYSLAYLAVLF